MNTKATAWRPGPSVCRCCLAEGCYKDISTEYFWMGKREVYEEMLADTFDLNIVYSKSGPNSNSRLICESCISRLRDATDFKRQVSECERTFQQYLDPAAISVPDIEVTVEALDKDVKIEDDDEVKEERGHSDDDDDGLPDYGDDDDDDDLDNQPLQLLATKAPKKESVDFTDLLDNAAASKRKCSKDKGSPAKRKRKEKTAKPKVEKKKKGCVDQSLKWTRKRKYNDQRDNAALVLEFSNAQPFRWKRGAFTCAFCPQSFGDYAGLREHAATHPNKIEAMRLTRPYDNVKVEISNLRCELCFASMKSLDELKDHLITVHEKPIIKDKGIGVTPFYLNGKEIVCTHCDERFELFSKLNMHMNQHYPNNICYHCGKAFVAAHRLKSHQAIHQLVDQYKCTKCPQVFQTRTLRNNHLVLVHGPEFRYRCPYCNDSFKSYSDRGRHLKESHGQKIEYPCHLCPAVFAMCNQRTKHIKQVHIKNKEFLCEFCPFKFVTAAQLRSHMIKHVGERKYQCEVCKKSYARVKTLKEHMRIHNNDKRFVCEYCNSSYVQKCSLQSHMKTHHPNAEPLKKIKLNLNY